MRCPVYLEISNQEAIVPGFDLFLIPVVLNADDPKWIVGQHHEALKEYGALLNWDEIIAEGYIILNREADGSAVDIGSYDLDAKDVAAYARMADKLFHMSIVYLEYSGDVWRYGAGAADAASAGECPFIVWWRH